MLQPVRRIIGILRFAAEHGGVFHALARAVSERIIGVNRFIHAVRLAAQPVLLVIRIPTHIAVVRFGFEVAVAIIRVAPAQLLQPVHPAHRRLGVIPGVGIVEICIRVRFFKGQIAVFVILIRRAVMIRQRGARQRDHCHVPALVIGIVQALPDRTQHLGFKALAVALHVIGVILFKPRLGHALDPPHVVIGVRHEIAARALLPHLPGQRIGEAARAALRRPDATGLPQRIGRIAVRHVCFIDMLCAQTVCVIFIPVGLSRARHRDVVAEPVIGIAGYMLFGGRPGAHRQALPQRVIGIQRFACAACRARDMAREVILIRGFIIDRLILASHIAQNAL